MKDLVAANPEVSPGVRDLVEEGLSPGTRKNYERALRELENEVGQITDFSLAHFLEGRFRAGIAPGTLNTTINVTP
jgi:hypothetical protein